MQREHKIRLHELLNARPRPTPLIQNNSTILIQLFTSALEDNNIFFWDFRVGHRFNIISRVYAIYIYCIIYEYIHINV